MTGRFSFYIGAGLAILLASAAQAQTQAPAPAQQCPPLTKFTSAKMERLANSRRVLVPVTINGVPKKFLLDTAGMAGFITKESSDELKLEETRGMRNHIKILKSFGLGGLTYEIKNDASTGGSNDTTLIAAEYPTSSDRDGDIDGTLTPGFLFDHGELDIDFPGGSLSLFSPEHCPGRVNYWGAPDIGSLPLSYDAIDLVNAGAFTGFAAGERMVVQRTSTLDLGHMTVPVTLDGHAFNAWIDTSAEKSSISLEVAERIFNLPRESLGPTSAMKVTPQAAMGLYNPHILNDEYVPTLANTDVPRPQVYRHKFSALTLGHIDIKNLELLIFPDFLGRNNDAARVNYYLPKVLGNWTIDIAGEGIYRSRNRKSPFTTYQKDVPDMVLGMDVLSHLHMYFALKEKRMYFSAGAAPAPTPPVAAQKAAQ